MKNKIRNIHFLIRLRGRPNLYAQGILFCCFGILMCLSSCDNVAGGRKYRIVKVYDGDTVGFDNHAKVRLLGIDCPEMMDNAKLAADARSTGQDMEFIKRQGREAFEFAQKFLLYQMVLVEFDKEKKDKYGRWLAYLWIELGKPGASQKVDIPSYYVKVLRKKPNGQKAEYIFINATLIKAGFAKPFNVSSSLRYDDMFRQLFDQAQKEKRGLWRNP